VKQTITVIILGLVPLFFFQNCGKPTELEFSSSLDLDSQSGVQNAAVGIINKHCSQCHSTTNMSGNVGDLTDIEYVTYSRLVVPGEPELSPIISQISQGLMPAEGPSLSGAEVDILKSWIEGLNEDALGPGSGPPVPVVIDPKYSVLAAQVFGTRCVGCHANRNFKLNSYAEILRTVTPGNAAGSLLYQAITVGANGGKMPQGGALTSAQIKAVEDWINTGAMNN
jgi:mono/diheme cytochrome c family protein